MTAYEGNDIYCDLIIPKNTEVNIIKETDNVMAFYHTNPHWPVHIIVIPKKHVASILEMAEESSSLAKELFEVVSEVAKMVKDKYGACRVVTNLGEYQKSKHLHVLVIHGDPQI